MYTTGVNVMLMTNYEVFLVDRFIFSLLLILLSAANII